VDHAIATKSKRIAAKTYRDLVAWQVSMDLVAEVYRLAARLPAIERYGLASQLRDAAVSISLNIAEGFGRRSRRDLSRFLIIADSSLREVQTLIDIIVRLKYLRLESLDAATNLANRTGFLLHRLRRSLREAP
jgi:four helix bundle protein